jgi:environmental stress-induced protein Ves
MFKIIKKEDLKTKQWSGGTTTELFIFPEGSSYERKDFIYRISTATVDVEESNFTKLEGVSRCIMVLNGEMKLAHKDHHTINLNKFETDSFSGEWDTKSVGKVTDFNLMTTNKRWAHIGSSILKKDETFITEQLQGFLAVALYVVKGKIHIENPELNETLEVGDFAVCNSCNDNNAKNTKIIAEEYTELAIAIIKE